MNEVQVVDANGLVEVANEQAVTSSRRVAEVFGKEHGKVLRAIDKIIAESGEPKLACEIFCKTTYD